MKPWSIKLTEYGWTPSQPGRVLRSMPSRAEAIQEIARYGQ